jgi:PAS domain S-box-containing protein
MNEFSRSKPSVITPKPNYMNTEEKLRASEERYRSLFGNMMDGFAFCKMIFDAENRPIDFVYLEINDAFVRITGLKRELVVGKKVTQAIPGIKEANPELFEIYGRVALSCREEKFEVFFKPLNMWLSISVYCPQKGYFAAIFEDITKRKQIQEALEKSEKRLNRSQEIAHLGSWELNLKNDKLTWSDEVYRIFGLKPQEFGATYEAFLSYIHPDDRATVDASYSGSLRKGKDSYEIEHRVIKKHTGEIRFVHEKCNHIRDESGKIVRSVGMVQDVTEQKKSEQELWQAKQDWERTFDSVPDFIAVLDNNFRIVRANKAMVRQLGVSPEKAVGLYCYQCVHGLYSPPDFCPHAKTVNDGKEHTAEVHEPRLGGDFLVSTTPLRDDKGNIVGTVHVARNITERKKAEAVLSNLNRHLRAIGNSNETLMHATDEDTLTKEICNIIVHDCGYALVWVGMTQHDKNKTVRPVAYAGFDKEYIDQLNITWADKPRGRGPTGTVIRTGKPYICRNMNLDPKFGPWREQAAKRKYTASLVLPLSSFEGKTFGALNIYSQEKNPFTEEESKLLTELANDFAYGIEMLRLRKEKDAAAVQLEKYANQMEELAKERAQQLSQAERLIAIGQTAGMVGHDIRNPLQAIVGELYLAKDEINSIGNGEAKKSLQESCAFIEQNLFYIDKIVADLQDYTKPLKPNWEKVNVEKAIEEALLIVAIPNSLKVDIAIEEGFPLFTADFSMLKRALINLIQNAVQAMPNGGRLKIIAKCENNQTCISVHDSGEGITVEVQDKLFTPLFTTKSKGQGFGLAVVKRLVEAQNGKISFSSQQGKGTTFNIQIPIK